MARNKVLAVTVPVAVALGLLWVCTVMVAASIGELEFVGFPSEIGFTSEEVQLEGWLKFNEKEHEYAENIRLWVTGHEGRIEPEFIEGPLYDGETTPITVYLDGVSGVATLHADDIRCPLGSWTIQLVPDAEVTASANCLISPTINIASGDGGQVTYQFTATSENAQQEIQVIEVEGTATVEPYSQTIELGWGEELDRYGTYTFTWDVEFQGDDGSYAEASSTLDQICNQPEAEVTADAGCLISPTINITSDDGGQITYNFTATSQYGEQVIEVEGTATVTPSSHTIERGWVETLDRYGIYTFTWDVDFIGNYGSSGEHSGTLTETCNTPPPPSLTVDANCDQASINITSDDGGQVTSHFTATSQYLEQVVEVEDITTVEPGSHNIELEWGEDLNRYGIYTFTWDVDFIGNYGSSGEHSGTLTETCNTPPPPSLTVDTDCDQASINITSGDGGQITYNFTAVSEDGQQVVEVEGTTTVEPGSHNIELKWGEDLNRPGIYTFTWDVGFQGKYGSYAEHSGTLAKPCIVTVLKCYCCSPGHSIFRIDASDFYGYPDDCRDASRASLIRVTSPPAPLGWNQPDFVPDSSWQSSSEVWSPFWADLPWAPQPGDCKPLGLRDESGDPDAFNRTTHLHRQIFTLSSPGPCMRVTGAFLEMWSDNKTEWWWQGTSVSYNGQGKIGQVDLFPAHVEPYGGTYVLAIQNSNDRMCGDDDKNCNPHGTACRLCVSWSVTEPCHHVYLPLILKAHP